MQRTTKVRVLKETPTRVTLHFITLNRKIPITREEFKDRVDSGEYEVVER